MNIRETSLKAYNEITEDGTREKLKHRVWKYIIDNGPCTQAQTHAALCRNWGDGSGSYTARFSELKRQGVIKEVGKTINLETNKECYLWDVTGRGPIKMDREKRFKCKHCNGRGFLLEQQTRLF